MKYSVILTILACCLLALTLSAGCQDAAELVAIACEELEGKDRDHCIQQLAVGSGNLDLCEDIESAGPKSKCWAYIAAEKKDPWICANMENEDWYGKQGAYDQFKCFQYLAKETGDPDICNSIDKGYSDQFGSDLNPDGVSQEICYSAVQCGNPGQKACYSIHKKQYWCFGAEEITYSNSASTCPT
jgi:hypothetical protein